MPRGSQEPLETGRNDTGYSKHIQEDARLIILKELASQSDGRLNSSRGLVTGAGPFGLPTDDWLAPAPRDEGTRRHRAAEIGSVLVARRSTRAGVDHCLRRTKIEGIKQPSLGASEMREPPRPITASWMPPTAPRRARTAARASSGPRTAVQHGPRPGGGQDDIVWAVGELNKRDKTQDEILFELNDRLAAKDIDPISRSAFNRKSVKLAAMSNRLNEARHIFAGLAPQFTADKVDEHTRGARRVHQAPDLRAGAERRRRLGSKGAMELARATSP